MELLLNYLLLPEKLGKIYFHGPRKNKKIAITFDDSLSEETLKVLKILKKYKAKATFFIEGKRILGKENILRGIVKQGNEIGNHTFNHKRLIFKNRKFIKSEIIRTDKLFEKNKIKTNLFRPPCYSLGLNCLRVCKDLKKKIIFSDVISQDWKLKGVDYSVNIVLSKVKKGSIINLHDYLEGIGRNKDILEILEKILEKLQGNYKFVTISNLIKD